MMHRTRFAIPAAAISVFISAALAFGQGASAKPAPEPATFTLSAPLITPKAIDVDQYGRFYVLDDGRQCVMRFNLLGELERSWKTDSHYTQSWCGRITFAISPNGTMFIGPGFLSPSILRVSPKDTTTDLPIEGVIDDKVALPRNDGSFVTLRRVTEIPGGAGKITGWMLTDYSDTGKAVSEHQFDADSYPSPSQDGLVYVGNPKSPVIRVYDLSGNLKLTINFKVPAGWQPSRLQGLNVQVDTNGDMYACSGDGIARFDRDGLFLGYWDVPRGTGRPVPIPGNFKVKNGLIYVLTSEEVYTSTKEISPSTNSYRSTSEFRNDIRVYTCTGQCVGRYVPTKPDFQMPSSIAVEADGRYVVTELGTNQAYLVSGDGRKLLSKRTGMDVEPAIVSAKPDGGFYLGSQELDKDGTFVKDLYVANPEITENFVQIPSPVAVDPQTKNLWTLATAGILSCYAPDGKVLKQFKANEKLNFKSFAIGMAIDRKGIIYISDAWGNRIVKVDQDGNFVRTFGSSGIGLGQLMYPEGIAFDSQDRLYVADCENSRIQVFSTDGEPLAVWGKPGHGDGELNSPYGVTIGPGNMLWIADTMNDRIVKVALSDFWREAKHEIKPAPVVALLKTDSAALPGEVAITGIVIAGSDDLSDVVYVERPDRSSGITVTLPKNKQILRGRKIRVVGKLENKERSAAHLIARIADEFEDKVKTPGPLGMANLYVGDGYRSSGRKVGLGNLGLLVRTWGKVVSVDRDKSLFTISDGSDPRGTGLVVYAGNLRKPLTSWPEVGQFVCVTGVSTASSPAGGKPVSEVRVRGDQDIQLLK